MTRRGGILPIIRMGVPIVTHQTLETIHTGGVVPVPTTARIVPVPSEHTTVDCHCRNNLIKPPPPAFHHGEAQLSPCFRCVPKNDDNVETMGFCTPAAREE